MPPHPSPKARQYALCKSSGNATSPCGQITTIVLDDATFHNPLNQTDDIKQDTYRKSALQGLIDRGHTAALHKSGIDIFIASS